MSKLAKLIGGLLINATTERYQSTSNRSQIIFVGPPIKWLKSALEEIETYYDTQSEQFDGLTYALIDNEDLGWRPSVNGARFITTHWQFTVSLRDPKRRLVIMCDPMMWSTAIESIENSSELLGSSRFSSPTGFRPLWSSVVQSLSIATSISKSEAESLVNSIIRTTGRVEDDHWGWEAIDRLLEATDRDSAYRAAGLPKPDVSGENAIGLGEKVLADLSKFCVQNGLDSTAELILESGDLGAKNVEAVRQMFQLVRDSFGSSGEFDRQAVIPERISDTETWWNELGQSTLAQILEDLKPDTSTNTLVVEVVNKVFIPDSSEPTVVRGQPTFRVKSASGDLLSDLTAIRRVTYIPGHTVLIAEGDTLTDRELPEYIGRPAKYVISAKGHKDIKVDVIPLDVFATRCIARIETAESNRPPSIPKKGQPVAQQIEITTAGPYDVDIYVSDQVNGVDVSINSELADASTSLGKIILSAPNKYSFRIDEVDRSADYVILPSITNVATPEPHTINFSIDEPDQSTPSTRFGALIQAHEMSRRRPKAASVGKSTPTDLSMLYLRDEGSWRGISACPNGQHGISIDWSNDTVTNGIKVLEDRRPPKQMSVPPSVVLRSRNRVRELLLSTSTGRIEDTDLAADEIAEAVSEYSDEYLKWLNEHPDVAMWMDCIAIFSPVESTTVPGSFSPSVDPHAILMSPLHPARLAWHVNAQILLSKHLDVENVPSTSLIDPHSSPSVCAMPLWDRGRVSVWQQYKSVRSLHVHWQLFINPAVSELARSSAERQLQQLEFYPDAVAGSFSRTQSKRALLDASEQLSARSNFSVGLIGQPQSSSMLERGVLEWITSDNDEDDSVRHDAATIVDGRLNAYSPTSDQLGLAAEKSIIGLKWYTLPAGERSKQEHLDIVLLNELSISQQRVGEPKLNNFNSATTPGALTRRDIRVDEEIEVFVSVVSRPQTAGLGIANTAGNIIASVEAIAAKHGAGAYIVRPSDDIRTLFEDMHSKFVGVTSTAVDAGSFMRLAKRLGKVLWDFELPVPQKSGLEPVGLGGYYLMAQPDDVLKQRLKMGSEGVGVDRDNESMVSSGLMTDIQELGIPVLRKIGRSPAGSRGEIGLILAVRFLQGSVAIPDHPRLPLKEDRNVVNLIVPVDSYWPITRLFKPSDRRISDSHPDLLLLRLDSSDSECLKISCAPIEVKFRTSPMSESQVKSAVSQARNLSDILDSAWNASTELPQHMGRLLLATYVDHGFRMANNVQDKYEWVASHQDHLDKIMQGSFTIGAMLNGAALVFDSSGMTTAIDASSEHRFDAIKFSKSDIKALLEGTPLSGEAELSYRRLISPLIGTAIAPERPATDSSESTSSPDSNEPNDSNGRIGQEPDLIDDTDRRDDTGQDAASSEPENKRLTKTKRSSQVEVAFNTFIGNRFAIERISIDLKRALMDDPPSLPRNYLLTGPPSTGKTELAKRIANALKLPFIRLDGRALTNRERLFDLVDGELQDKKTSASDGGSQAGLPVFDYPPMIIFVDEIHLATKGVQESLLTTLEADDRTVTLKDRVALVGKATFIFATTRTSGIDAAFKSRCTEIELKPYSVEEVATILKLRHPRDWPEDVFLKLSRWGRAVPRHALDLAVQLETSEDVARDENGDDYDIDKITDHVRWMNQLDDNGLTHMHYEYLGVLNDAEKAMGQETITRVMSTVDEAKIVEDIEPFLFKERLVVMTGQGRQITALGRSYLVENSIPS
jgi:Holliday junction resolvasome RuvABC ATP-dependent DNA helicase subunit